MDRVFRPQIDCVLFITHLTSSQCTPSPQQQVAPGTRVSVIGVFSTFTAAARGRGGSAVKSAYIKAVGIQVGLGGRIKVGLLCFVSSSRRREIGL